MELVRACDRSLHLPEDQHQHVVLEHYEPAVEATFLLSDPPKIVKLHNQSLHNYYLLPIILDSPSLTN